ncbi:Uncharacterised protein [Burkholderia pseudomallei]|nr:hypothetical protein DP49_6723 [Burkholderia pseudomallei]CAJ5200009.1 Uncharacterised protein [Burkholderia pseudomallei]CAJ5208899.1 Uncharacterised protein [Burkholderia pseudomallei]CAJ7724615.1 Uncharacterised protein [Burkholderia pseudomallei]CAJ7845958.1 Uncharacterised protein [Burkholderia pseudomallei]
MAERMDGRRRVRPEAVADDAQHARRAERHEAVAGLGRADAERARRVVAAAARDDHRFGQAERARDVRAQRAGRRVAFDDPRHLRARHAARGEQRAGPVAARRVEPQRARRVGRVGHLLARELQAQIILRHQHARDPAEHIGLVPRDPQQLRRGEARHREVAGDRMQLGRARFEQRAFVGAAHVVPQDRGAQHAIAAIEQHRAVHLAGQPDAAHRGERLRMARAQRGERGERAGPPVVRMLLGPARMRARDGKRRARRADDGAVGRKQQHLHFGGAEIDAEVHERKAVRRREAATLAARPPPRQWRFGPSNARRRDGRAAQRLASHASTRAAPARSARSSAGVPASAPQSGRSPASAATGSAAPAIARATRASITPS